MIIIKVRKKLGLLKFYWRKLGTRGLLRHLYFRYLKKSITDLSTQNLGKIDVVSFYDFVRHQPFGEPLDRDRCDRKSVNWVIPDFGIGSGGHINIFRLVENLERQGYTCHITIVGPCQFASGEAARDSIRKHFSPVQASVGIGEASLQPAWITVATSWITAHTVRNFRGTALRCYFVQDFEPFFYAHGSDYLWAEQTYRFNFFGITAGQWLADKLAREYGMRTAAMGFSFDRDLYRPYPRRDPHTRTVFFYARPVTPRRAFELGLLVLAEVAKQLPDTQFILAGWDTSNYVLPFQHSSPGVLALKDLPELYSQCDAALVLSFTNLSLLPLELMASGCPVVSNRGPNVEWLLTEDVAVLAEPTVEALSEALVALLLDEPRRKQLVEQGLAYAEQTSWEAESDKVAKIFDRLSHEL